MPRGSTINTTITAQQMRLIRERVRAGRSRSASDVVRQALELLFERDATAGSRSVSAQYLKAKLAAGYKAMAAHDRKVAREWAQLDDAWIGRSS
jgi:putative addiction module CopG family antidote